MGTFSGSELLFQHCCEIKLILCVQAGTFWGSKVSLPFVNVAAPETLDYITDWSLASLDCRLTLGGSCASFQILIDLSKTIGITYMNSVLEWSFFCFKSGPIPGNTRISKYLCVSKTKMFLNQYVMNEPHKLCICDSRSNSSGLKNIVILLNIWHDMRDIGAEKQRSLISMWQM